MARIFLDAWGVKREPHGIARYCRSLVPALVAAAPQHEFVVVRPPRRCPDDRIVPDAAIPEFEIRLPQTDWATIAFRPFLERAFRRYGRPDLYHSMFQMLPVSLKRGACAPRRVVVTLHDLIAVDFADLVKENRVAQAWMKQFDPIVIPYALRQADHVICVSDVTRQRAAEWVPLEQSTTVHSGVAATLFEPTAPAPLPYGAGRFSTYVAALGVGRPYKNVACVVRALAEVRRTRPDVGLVLIGGDGGAANEIQRLGFESAVVVTPQVGDTDLKALVGAARLFVTASRAEGFGLPVLEAMAIGTPVAASDIPVLREIAGGAALWFDGNRPEQLAAIVIQVLDDANLRSRLASCGRAHARAFTWQQTARGTLAVYDSVLSADPSSPGCSTTGNRP